jgi:pSer/pThr/pTyr-binding forkhead associated (FHA) protein
MCICTPVRHTGLGKELILVNYDDNETTIYLKTGDKQSGIFKSIEIFYQGKVNSIASSQLPFAVGRDKQQCQLVLRDKAVSRQHFAFVVRDGMVGLHDMSTNGTWVQLGRSEGVLVRNSFLPLVGSGTINPGSEVESDEGNKLLFKVIYEQAP